MVLMAALMEENRCIICGKKLNDPLALYCPECEFELKRVRLADEETVEEWMERMKSQNISPPVMEEREHIKPLDAWF